MYALVAAAALGAAITGDRWDSTTITYSFVPDGTVYTGPRAAGVSPLQHSSLNAVMGAAMTQDVWQGEIRRALQAWDDASALTFVEVSDDGSGWGVGGLPQGDPRFGDIRFFAADVPNAIAISQFPPKSTDVVNTMPGNIVFDSRIGNWGVWSQDDPYVTDLFSVAIHEIGHAIGLDHSADPNSVMSVVGDLHRTGLCPDDVLAVQSIYGVPEPAWGGVITVLSILAAVYIVGGADELFRRFVRRK